ncbi:MAG: DUF1178 family protein [Geminicoccaceae bacterium]
MQTARRRGPRRSRLSDDAAAGSMRLWRKVRNHIEKNFDQVGPQFAEEARKMHHGEPRSAASAGRRRPRPRSCATNGSR